MRIVAIGSKASCYGFALAGIREFYEVKTVEDVKHAVSSVLKNPRVGIVVMDDLAYKMLPTKLKKHVESLARPVFVRLSSEGGEESLEVVIRRALGVDLAKLKKGEKE